MSYSFSRLDMINVAAIIPVPFGSSFERLLCFEEENYVTTLITEHYIMFASHVSNS